MSHIRVLICRVDEVTSDQMTELAAFDLPAPAIAALHPTSALDDLETVTHETGNAILRRVLQAQWDLIDAALVVQHRQDVFPQSIIADGHEPVTVASHFGTLQLSRQVCQHPGLQTHALPGNAVLPRHHGIIITRGLQEWACLLPQELPFASVARLLGWQTQEPQVLGATTLRSLVRSHGQVIRHTEQAEVASLAARDDLAMCDLHLVPHDDQPRRRAGWPVALNAAVDAALAATQVCPPAGVSWADWERVLAARRADAARLVEDLRLCWLLSTSALLTPTPFGLIVKVYTSFRVDGHAAHYRVSIGTNARAGLSARSKPRHYWWALRHFDIGGESQLGAILRHR